MAKLTEEERQRLAERSPGAIVRPVEQWREILRDLPPHEAAARIFGDLMCYSADRGHKRRDSFLDDVRQLANVLEAWTTKANCPDCGAVVPTIFEHVDGCPGGE